METKKELGRRIKKVFKIYFPDKKFLQYDLIIPALAGIIIAAIIFFPLKGLGSAAVIMGMTGVWVVFGARMFPRTASMAFEGINFVIALLLLFSCESLFGSGYACGMIQLSTLLIVLLSGIGLILKTL